MKTGKEYWDLHHKDTVELFKTRPDWMQNYDNDYPSAVLIRGLIEEYKPENILEIGTAAGWAAYYMLEEALKHNPYTKITSIDFGHHLYYSQEREIGAAFKEVSPNLYEKWQLKTGLMAVDFAANCKEKYDFVFIDANHIHPWATLDFIAILPLLKENAIVVFHDVYLNEICLGKKPANRHPDNLPVGQEMCKGPNVIYNIFKKEMVLSYDDIAPNCAAMIVKNKNEILQKLLFALNSPWENKYLNSNQIKDIIPKYFDFVNKNFEKKIAKNILNSIKTNNFKLELLNNIRNITKKFVQFNNDYKKSKELKHNIKNKKAVFWGASEYLKVLVKQYKIDNKEIIGIIDVNQSRQGEKIGRYEIFSPEKLKILKPNLIIPAAINHPQIIDFIEKELVNQNLSIEIDQTLMSK